MKPDDRKQKALIEQRNRARRQCQNMTSDNKILIQLVERITSVNSEDDRKWMDALREGLPRVVQFFQLDADSNQALSDMVSLSLVGRSIQTEHQSEDPLSFAQIEWLLKDSEYYSILGTAMLLSLEKHDGSGPQSLPYDLLPPLSSAYRCLIEFANSRILYDDHQVVIDSLKRALVHYIEPLMLADFINEFSIDDQAHQITWLETAQLREGMTVLDDVRNSNGLLLIARLTTLTTPLIDSLLNYDGAQGLTLRIPIRK